MGMTEKAKRIIDALREDAEWAHANEWETPITLGDHLEEAADLIESLSAELEQVKRERDAAVDDLTYAASPHGEFCSLCKFQEREECENRKFEYITDCWQWRGAEADSHED